MENKNLNRPTHRVFQVVEFGEDKKSTWTQIGAAWAHKDNLGLNIQLDVLPLKGDIVIRKIVEEGL